MSGDGAEDAALEHLRTVRPGMTRWEQPLGSGAESASFLVFHFNHEIPGLEMEPKYRTEEGE